MLRLGSAPGGSRSVSPAWASFAAKAAVEKAIAEVRGGESVSDPNAEEPPADHWIRDIWAVWDQIEVEPDSDKRNELFTQILDIWAEELPMVGYLGESPALIIVKNGVHNYLPGFPIDDTTGDEHLLNTETYFWESA